MATTRWTLITGKGPSARHEIFYLGESTVGAVRIDDYKYRFIDQPQGWLGEKTHVDVPYITNLRLDPFERKGWPNNGTKEGAQQYFDWFKFQFWRFVFVQQVMGKELQTFLDYPPMQRGASFNLDAVKAEMAKRMATGGGGEPKAPATNRNDLHGGRLASGRNGQVSSRRSQGHQPGHTRPNRCGPATHSIVDEIWSALACQRFACGEGVKELKSTLISAPLAPTRE